MRGRGLGTVLAVALGLLGGARLSARDWPMWRADAGRSAYSSEKLPPTLHLQWVRQYSPRTQVWDDPLNHDLMPYDKVFEPVVLGGRIFIPFNDTDKVVALDLRSGAEQWRFYADGPVRLPPVGWKDKVYFTSDDGHLYCVGAADGVLRWKFLGGPSARKALGNGRVISAWPARGGPVIRDGVVYFAASIWPFMGTFLYALDAATGKVVWVNDGTSAQFIKQPHSALAFAGVAPQGALAATADYLLVPGGRSVPAVFARKTGDLLHFNIDDGGKGVGGSFVIANNTNYFVHTRSRGVRDFELKTGKKGKLNLTEPVLSQTHLYSGQETSALQAKVVEAQEKLAAARYGELKARSELRDAQELADAASWKKATNAVAAAVKKVKEAEQDVAKEQGKLGTNWAGRTVVAYGPDRKVQWELAADATGDLIKVGSRLYAAGANAIVAIDPPSISSRARVAWSLAVDGTVLRLLAANGMLLAVTLDGRILAFGGKPKAAPGLRDLPEPLAVAPADAARASSILAQADARAGYALWYGVEDGALVEALAADSELHIVAVDPDERRVDQLRRRLDRAGLYGTRVAVHTGDPLGYQAPPLIANLVVVGAEACARLKEPRYLEAVFASVRPYGGTLWAACGPQDRAALADRLQSAQLAQARVHVDDDGVRVVREGALPGSADWTHQYGNIANTVKSDDATVKLPLGVLWFGGVSHCDVLPRHGHGPSEQVVGGRLFIQGMTSLSARDVYTGRQLWKTEIPELGTEGIYYDETYDNTPLSTIYNQRHIPGANARGANYAATPDAIYLAVGSTCRVLSTRNGETLRVIQMPQPPEATEPVPWAFIGVYQDVLLGGAGFAHFSRRFGSPGPGPMPSPTDLMASAGLAAFDRHTGELLWQAQPKYSFLHNAIVAGNGRVYCLDRLPSSAEGRLKRRGLPRPEEYHLVALDARTGRRLWEQPEHVRGSWLSYSEPRDLLLLAGASATDRLKDEVGQGMATYRGCDGSMIWTNNLKYTGPCILHNDVIVTTPTSHKASSGALNLADGSTNLIANPLTGEREPWRIYRTYGCNTPIASEHMLTFRSGAAGFYDLETHAGTGNFGGFKSGCTPSLIVANGVLNSPDYTRTCSCAYQNQTSLAFVHMPELEVWTYNLFGADFTNQHRVKRLGLNFGAPGDRRADSGTLWLEYPIVGGNSATLSVAVSGSGTNYYRRHSSQVGGQGLAWVMASGLRNVESITLVPALKPPPPPRPSTNTAKSKPAKDEEDEDEDKNGTDSAKSSGTNTTRRAVAAAPRKLAAETPLAARAYTVRLHFAEPDDVAPGQRVFGVQLQGQSVLDRLDLVAEAGGRGRGLIKSFENIVIADKLSVVFKKAPRSRHGPVICGLELIEQESGFSASEMP